MSSLAGSGCGLGFGRRASFSPLSLGPALWLRGGAGITLAADPALADGDMEAAGTGAWAAAVSTLSKEAGSPGGSGSQVLRVTSLGAAARATQAVLTIGNVYWIRGWARGDGGTGIPVVGAGWTGSNSTLWQPVSLILIASTTTFRLQTGSNPGDWSEFDDIEITNLSITAQADQSGNAKHATQATATKQPYLDDPARGGTGRNGKAVVRYFGGQCLQTPAIDLSGTAQATVATVYVAAVAATGILVEQGASAAINDGISVYLMGAAPNCRLLLNGSGGAFGTEAYSVAEAWSACVAQFDTAIAAQPETTLRRNGAGVAVGTLGGAATSGVFSNNVLNIGARDNAAAVPVTCYLAELLLFPRLLSAGELALLETDLMTAWGLP